MDRSSRRLKGAAGEYLLAELIGQGQFGKVHRGECTFRSSSVAIKVIRRSKFVRNQKLKQLLQREMQVLCGFSHPNVIEFVELIVEGQDVYLVYEYCEGGTLQERIGLQEAELIPLMQQMLEAMCGAQAIGIIHRDIKPANILFKQGRIKIADWGFSRLLGRGETTCSFIGSPAYMAPEVLKGHEYSLKADVWSLGVVLYEALTGVCPWSSRSIHSLQSEITNKPLLFPKGVKLSSRLRGIITRMLSVSAAERPGCSEIRALLKGSLQSSIKSCPEVSGKFSRTQGAIKKGSEQSPQRRKIMSCMFFLQLVQWVRKCMSANLMMLTFVRLIEKNLCKLKPESTSEREIRGVWEKEMKVINGMKRKLEVRLADQLGVGGCEGGEGELNPEGEWEVLVRGTVKLAMDELQRAYKQVRNEQQQKERTLTEINLLLDLVLFQQLPQQYLKSGFQSYSKELMGYTPKTLLKLINCKLLLVNKRYYN